MANITKKPNGTFLIRVSNGMKNGKQDLVSTITNLQLGQRQPWQGRLLKSTLFSLRNLYIAVAMRRNRRSAGRSGCDGE